ncbi:MAG: TRAP transporter large permease [Lachnospiraceae bacterium]|jgi:tripartite ATP-independent transporter DctM subunit|nr:TRAP transporter large permease [Lachnospiraceae bacterium]
MSEQLLALIMLFGILFFLMAIRVPIAFSLGISSMITALYLGVNLFAVFQSLTVSLYNFTFLAIPFFILSASIMTYGGISDKLMQLSRVIVGKIAGGTAMVNIVVSMLFGGISGSSVADVSSIGSMLIPAMVKEGYDQDYSVAVTVTSSVQGIIIPPSQNMIYYCIAGGGLSISTLFLAGYIPGILLGISLMIPAYVLAKKRNYPCGYTYTFKEGLHICLDSVVGLMAIVIIIVSVCTGIASPTESAAIASAYGLLVTVFLYRTMDFKKLIQVCLSSLSSLASIMAVIAMSSMFGYLLSYLRIPTALANGIAGITTNPVIIMLLVNLFLLVCGMFMDMAVLIFMLTPILLPIVVNAGYDPIHFGIIMILNLGIGLCTPPVGNSLFLGCAIAGIPIEKSVKGFLPFYASMVILLIILIAFPQISLWLPSLVG